MPVEDIAVALGIAENTLRKHFGKELTSQARLRRMEVVEALHGAACKGSASAARAYLERVPEFEPPKPAEAGGAVPAKAPPKGKKAQANEDAVTAHEGTGWEGLLGPQAVQ